jgi:cobalt/nickel transport system permease protein
VSIPIDTLAHSNRLNHLPPAQKLGFALAMLLLALVSHYPVQIIIFIWMSVWTVVYAGIPGKIYRSTIAGVTIFLITGLPALALNFDPQIITTQIPVDRLWQVEIWGGALYLSKSGSLQAIEVTIRSLASTTALFFIVFTIPIIELAALGDRLRCPPIIIELLLLIYRCIFLLLDTAQKIITAQISRGGYRTQKLRMHSLNLLIRQLIQRTATRYQQLTLGINARGFEQEFRFWQPQSYRFSWRYARESICGFSVLAIAEILYRVYV